ncbi:hypothetical protein MGYG_07292 [Nannizzia gypsea CBS 118893]|uniref:Uncharacterized protein n=1 Tax=Arthroderma gypseum (strain ATCC MYA-4604 / CBS 118893) TaxID=535722 RepID=E4V2L8_ARTGP|nr:hypothetical protein MGYG_07292 [Nannizzia gypsea CBS 118893]EFR04283.1 hypothetical protein MGYG_07292 [Nannizzia gypsea CBS 118893]
MSRQEKMTAQMCHPPAKSTVTKATADHSSVSSADSPASTDATSVSLTEPVSLKITSNLLHKSPLPIPSAELQDKKAPTRFDKMLDDLKNKSPEELAAYLQKYGPKIVREGDPIPYDTDADIKYSMGEEY